ncbi:hypothetical protein [Aliidongia dinghuensis]|nr:hypothetical protein [Aliidongia dinghuensis]
MSIVAGLALLAGASATLAPDTLHAAGDKASAVGASGPAGTAPRPMKKRAGPPEVAPVVIGSVRYEPLLGGKARGLGQNGGDIVARDAKTGAELWTLRVYKIDYAANMEPDKQDIYITSLDVAPDGRSLLVTDERGRRWRVDTEARTATPE